MKIAVYLQDVRGNVENRCSSLVQQFSLRFLAIYYRVDVLDVQRLILQKCVRQKLVLFGVCLQYIFRSLVRFLAMRILSFLF